MLQGSGEGVPLPAGVAGALGKGDTSPERADEVEVGRAPMHRTGLAEQRSRAGRAHAHLRDEQAEHKAAGSKRGPSTLFFL